jgi:hypothetical protein
MVQPELLPGAVALVGKMASDAAKKTVIGIATTEGKKIGAAIGKDISTDAAREKAEKTSLAEPAQTSPDPAKPVADGASNVKTVPSEVSKDAPKVAEEESGLINGHGDAEKLPKTALPQPDAEKSTTHNATSVDSTLQQESKTVVVAAAASVTKTSTMINSEPTTPQQKPMATISQESLNLLHQSEFSSSTVRGCSDFSIEIDALHEAIKQITETLALHLPPPTPTEETSKQKPAEVLPTEAEPSGIDTPVALVEPVTPVAEQSPPKRPSLEKRSSVLGSIGKILWPFGSASPTKTVVDGVEVSTGDSNTPKVPTVTVTEVPLTPEIEI